MKNIPAMFGMDNLLDEKAESLSPLRDVWPTYVQEHMLNMYPSLVNKFGFMTILVNILTSYLNLRI